MRVERIFVHHCFVRVTSVSDDVLFFVSTYTYLQKQNKKPFQQYMCYSSARDNIILYLKTQLDAKNVGLKIIYTYILECVSSHVGILHRAT